MNNKVLVEIYVPTIGMKFNVFLPINKRLRNIIELAQKAIVDLSDNYYKEKQGVRLYNLESGLSYDDTLIVKETDIRNGTNLVMF